MANPNCFRLKSWWTALPALVVGLSLGLLAQEGNPATDSTKGFSRTALPKATAKAAATRPNYKNGRYAVLLPPKNFSPPILSIGQDTYDWGEVIQGEVVQHSFEIKNSGGAPLRVERVRPSCGCTTVDFDKLLEPGAMGKVTLKIETNKFSGTVRKTADILSNAGRSSQKLTMKGKIEPAFKMEPKIPRMEVVTGSQATPLTITLSRASANPIKVKSVKPKTDIVSATLKEVEPGNLYHVNVVANPPEGGRKYHYAQLDAEIEAGNKTLKIPLRVSVTVKERVEASPLSVYFTSRDTKKLEEEGAEPLTKTVDIKSLVPGHSFKVTDVERDTPAAGRLFETKLETVKDGEHYRLVVTLPKKPADNARRKVERLRILTDDEKVPVLKVTATASFSAFGKTTPRFPLTTKPAGVTTSSQRAPTATSVPKASTSSKTTQ